MAAADDAADAAAWVVLVALGVALVDAVALAEADAFGLALADTLGVTVAVLEASALAEAGDAEDLLEPVSLSPLTFA